MQTDDPLPVTGRRGCPLIPRGGNMPESPGRYELQSQMDLTPKFLVRGTKFGVLPRCGQQFIFSGRANMGPPLVETFGAFLGGKQGGRGQKAPTI